MYSRLSRFFKISPFLLLLFLPTSLLANLNVSVVDDPKIYRALDRLVALGLIDDAILSHKPISRSEARRLIAEAKENTTRIEGREIEPKVRMIILELEKRLGAEKPSEQSEREGEAPTALPVEGATQAPIIDKIVFAPFKNLSAEYLFLDSPSRGIPTLRGGGENAALINPLIAYRSGRAFENGQNSLLETTSELHVRNFFSISGAPQFFFKDPSAQSQKTEWSFDHLYLRTELKNVGIQIGRDAIAWGLSPEGGNFFTTNAKGLDMFKISNVHPFHLPWIFKHLGLMNSSFVFGVLGEDRKFPHAYLTAYKLTFLPHRNFEWSFTTALMSGGEGSPGASLGSRVADTFFGYIPNLLGVEGYASNRIGGFEFKYRNPKWRGLELYYEFTLEDLGFEYRFFHEAFNRVGLYLPRLSNNGNQSLRLEYKLAGFLPYKHHQYTSGWTHHRHLLGDELGPDSQGIYLTYESNPTLDWSQQLQFAWEERDSDAYLIPPTSSIAVQKTADNPSENRFRITHSFDWQTTKSFSVKLGMGYERVLRFNFNPGNNLNNFLANFKLTWHPAISL